MLKPSRKTAIDEMCKQCIYDPKDDGTWRKQVERCTSSGEGISIKCALFDVRPLPTNVDKIIEVKTVK